MTKGVYIYHFVMMLFLLSACDSSKDKRKDNISVLEQIKRRDTLRVVTVSNPVNYFIYKGTPMGFHYELSKAYAEALGVEFDIKVATDYKTAIDLLNEKKCDLLAMNMKTVANNPDMAFSVPFFISNPVLVQNKNSEKQYVKDWLEVDSLEVAVLLNSPLSQVLENIKEDLGLHIKMLDYKGISAEKMINMVAEDSIPATLADKAIARVAKTYYPQLDISIDAGLSHNVSWAVGRKSSQFLNHINGWLSGFKKTKKYKTLYTKYFLNHKSIKNNKTEFVASLFQLSPFDEIIKKEAKVLGWDWKLLASMIYVESRFREDKVSWAGAFGLMQLMPITARHYGINKTATTEEQIAVGRKLLQFLRTELKQSMKDTTDLQKFLFASYNAGLGHIQDARRLAQEKSINADNWEETIPLILQMNNEDYYNDPVVKHGYFRGQEPVEYVERISDVYRSYKILVPEEFKIRLLEVDEEFLK